ncbi:hypothetical protein WA588_005683, partial [Blastocystis sp. NMH]
MEWTLPRIRRDLCTFDLYPPHVKAASQSAYSGKVFQDELPDGVRAIGTHSGAFHSDEALAISLLRSLAAYRDYAIVRTRNDDILSKCDIVVDVGAEYDPAKKLFDHHQKSFTETFDDHHKTKLSSAGLVYKHFGRDIIRALCPHPLSDTELQVVYRRMYDNFVEEIDGVDNGIDPFCGERNYSVTTGLSSRIKRLSIPWNQQSSTEQELNRFRLAMSMMLEEFAERLYGQTDVFLPAREIVVEALDKAKTVHPSKEIVVIHQDCPFMDHLMELEKERRIEGRTKFVLVHNKDDSWRVRAINLKQGSFALRQKLLPHFCGLRDDELSKACGIANCVFVHSSGFMGINKTFDGALQMA